MTKYETFGAHPEWQFLVLRQAIDFLSEIGIARIQARLYSLTSRWMTRAQRLDRFRAAVTLDPSHCAGLVGWELSGIENTRVKQVLTDRRIQIGRTESYAGFFSVPKEHPR